MMRRRGGYSELASVIIRQGRERRDGGIERMRVYVI